MMKKEKDMKIHFGIFLRKILRKFLNKNSKVGKFEKFGENIKTEQTRKFLFKIWTVSIPEKQFQFFCQSRNKSKTKILAKQKSRVS